jgi:NitT/TauT family transport system substrate-binding protein
MAIRISRRTALGAFAGSLVASYIPRARAEEKLRVGKAVVENIGFLPLDVGMEAGIFQRQGLTIEALDFAGGAKIAQAMAAGAVDISLSAGPDMAFVAKGAPEIAVGAITESPAFMAFCVGAQSIAHTSNDLKGKRVGITSPGSLTEWLVNELNRVKGWNDDGDRMVKIVIGGATPTAMAALKTGQVDATISARQVGYLFEEQQAGRLLFDAAEYVRAIEMNTIFASTTLTQRNPDAVRHFLKGWYESVAFMKSHKAESVVIGARAMGDPPAVVARAYDSLMKEFSTNGRFNPDAVKTLISSFVQLKTVTEPVDTTKLYTEEFLPKTGAQAL